VCVCVSERKQQAEGVESCTAAAVDRLRFASEGEYDLLKVFVCIFVSQCIWSLKALPIHRM